MRRTCDCPLPVVQRADRGVPNEPDAYGNLDWDGSYEPPQFCMSCGNAFPWVGREGRIYELQNRLDREPLDDATKLTVREQLEALSNPDLTEEQQLERWRKVKRLAPELLRTGRSIVDSLATAYMKKELGL
jgi:hypothetical protein